MTIEAEAGDNDPAVQAYRLRVVEADVRAIKDMVQVIHDHQIKNPSCPRPGLCIDVEKDVKDLQRSYHALQGAWITIGVVCTIASAVLTWLITYFNRH